jgi:hypothetical protein
MVLGDGVASARLELPEGIRLFPQLNHDPRCPC